MSVAGNTGNADAAVGLLNYWVTDPDAIELFGAQFGSPHPSAAVEQISGSASPALKKLLDFGTEAETIAVLGSPRPPGGTEVETIIARANEAVASGAMTVDEAATEFYLQSEDAIRIARAGTDGLVGSSGQPILQNRTTRKMTVDEQQLDIDEVRSMHTQMAVLRYLEERVRELRLAEEVVGSVHLALGQEAIAVGACAALSPTDTLAVTYRGHGWAVAKGCRLSASSPSCSDVRRGSMAGAAGRPTCPHASTSSSARTASSGPAHRSRSVQRSPPATTGSHRVSVAVFGDGAINQGSVSEAFNFAAALKLPVIFVCENNGLSELTRIDEMVAEDRLYLRAGDSGSPVSASTAMIPPSSRPPLAGSVDQARAGEGPTLIEAVTQRIAGHYIGDAELYLRDGERDAALADEPLVRSRRRLERLESRPRTSTSSRPVHVT